MAEVKVLVEGYAKEVENGWRASSTVVLVRSNDKNIVIDPGCNREELLKSLRKENLEPKDIDFVILTHNHTDHILLSGIFENAKTLNDTEIYDNDLQIEHNGEVPGTDIEIISTPGHDQFHCAVVIPVNGTKYVVAGDVFWWEDDEAQESDDIEVLLNKTDPYVKNPDELRKSREKILAIADYIIPGHGKMFKVKK